MEAMPRGCQFVREDLVGKFLALPTGQVEIGTPTEPNAEEVDSANLRQQLETQQHETRILRQQLQQQQSSQQAANPTIQQPPVFVTFQFQTQQEHEVGIVFPVIHPQK